MHNVMFITETKIEALFSVFLREFHARCDEYLAGTEWLIENIMFFSKRVHSHKLMKFYVGRDKTKSDPQKYL